MTKAYPLGKFAGLILSFDVTAVLGTLVGWIVFALILKVIFDFGIGAALSGGLFLMLWHWVGELLHQYGHALAARRVGHPMIGVHLFTLLGRSIYPANEGTLPAHVHIRRALGGPIFSAGITVILAIFAFLILPASIPLVMFLDNLLVFTLGAFMPLGFTDGSTLLYWSRHHA
jgi:hypothetical protein